jgi:hypothetical protein
MTPPQATEANPQSHQIKGQHQHLECRSKESGNTASSRYAQSQKCRVNMAFLHSAGKSLSHPCSPDGRSIDTRWYHPRVESKRRWSPAERGPLPSMAALPDDITRSELRTAMRCHGEVDDGRCCGAAGKLRRCSAYPYGTRATLLRPGGWSSSFTAAEAGGEKWDVLSLPA